MNPILERAVEEEGKKKKKSFEESYQKRKLLVAELNKAQEKSNFTDGYGKTPSSVEMSAAFRRISRHGEQKKNFILGTIYIQQNFKGMQCKFDGGKILKIILFFPP